VLEQDIRPSYQRDEERIYGMEYAGYEIKFQVCNDILIVRDVYSLEKEREGYSK
jgi:hypothetical protein